MYAYLETFSKQRRIRHGSSVAGTCLFVLEVAEARHVLTILDGSKSQLESQSKQQITVESASVKNPLGRVAVLDAHGTYIFASLADRRRLYVLPKPNRSFRIASDQAIHELGLEEELFGLKSLRNRLTSSYPGTRSAVTAAISVSGEVVLLCAFGNKPEIKQRKLEVPAVEKVAYVTTYEDDYLVVVGVRNSNLLFYAIHINQGKELDSTEVEVLPEVLLPHAPCDAATLDAQDGIIGFAIQKDSAVVLYPRGYVHFLGPMQTVLPSTDASFASRWCSGPPNTLAVVRHAMKLSGGRTFDEDLTSPKDCRSLSDEGDGVVALNSDFFAIAYGEYISIWDGSYYMGHSYVQASTNIDFLFRDPESGNVFAVSKDTVQLFKFDEKIGVVPVTLSAAIKRKGSCDPIVVSTQKNVERAPLRSQPVTVGPVQAAAESGGQIDRIFQRVMETEENQEVKQVRALLSREAIPSAEALIATTQTYFKHKHKVRRGDYGSERDLGLAKLPSERFAAVTVARCVFEIGCGNTNFVVPFIDMLGTGVVSSDAVVSVLGVSDSWDMGPETKSLNLSSICEPLIASDAYLNGLEAVLSRVVDLPERDIVKVFRFAVQLTIKIGSATGSESLKRWRCKRLLTRCIAHRVQQHSLVQIIKKLPFTDAMACIGVLEEILDSDQRPPRDWKSEVPPHVSTGKFVTNGIAREEALMYRGLGNWLDKDYRQQLKRGEVDETEACVRWISCIIDAHLTAFIMDENGRQVASRMLDLIRERRKESEALKGVWGLVSHIVARKAVPDHEDPLYKLTHHKIPFRMALD